MRMEAMDQVGLEFCQVPFQGKYLTGIDRKSNRSNSCLPQKARYAADRNNISPHGAV